jgi:hypothetical protein
MIRASWAALCLIWLAAPSSADEGLVARRPSFHPGDSFSYADRFETVACREWRVQAVDAAGNMMSTRCGEYTAYFAPDGGITRIVDANGKELVRFSPEAAPIPFPLTVGSRWTSRFEVHSASQMVSPDIDESCQATGIETVTLNGKPQPAFHIDCTDRWSVAFLSGSNSSVLWYAPDARAVVKAVNASAPEWSLQMTGYVFSSSPDSPSP